MKKKFFATLAVVFIAVFSILPAFSYMVKYKEDYYKLFQEELAKAPAYAFICYIDANYVAKSSIHGIAPNVVLGHHGVGIFWNIHEWTISK